MTQKEVVYLSNPASCRPDEDVTLDIVLFTKRPEAFSASGTWIELTRFDFSEDGITRYWLANVDEGANQLKSQ
jgi:hypothetical protein